jgi:hypothetical protein
LENLEEMDTFLNTYNLPTFNHEDLEHLNTPVISNKIESVIKSDPRTTTTKAHDWMALLLNVTKPLKKN